MPTTVVNLNTHEFDIYVGRAGSNFPNKWGNPFRIGRDGNREQVIAKHKAWIVNQPDLMAEIHTLKDKRLGCFCAPKTCHGDNLAELANAL